jgi:SRSO17 transposase
MQVSELGIREINEVPPPLDLTPQEIEALADDLVQYHAEFAELYYRVEQAHWGEKYLQGLLLPVERKSIEPLALALEGGNVQAMQQFIGQGQWQDEPLLHKHWHLVDDTLGEADGVCIVDSSDFPKQGEHSVGVARQWCGRLGKVDNCQAGVFTAYASRKGYTLLDRRLYLPEEWFDAAHRARWRKCGIPDQTPFQTKPTLALEMVQALVQEGGLRFRWVTGDEAFGRDGAFLDGIAALGRWYFAEVPHDTQVWLTRPATAVPAWTGRGRRPRKARLVPGAPAPQRVDQLAAAVPPEEWQAFLIKEGSKGPLVANFACQRGVAVRGGLPGPDVWMVFRRTLGESPELKVYLSNAPAHTPGATLVRIAGMRWPIETAFEESKGGLGLDHYEVRTWLGWHHHMTLCLLAHHFLVRARLRVKKGRQR